MLKRGLQPMSAKERAVAVQKLIASTGTRGIEFAVSDALEGVLQYRAFRAM